MLYFTSDTHFGHGNIIKYSRRPGLSPAEQAEFDRGENPKVAKESVAAMDTYLLDGINATVGPDDVLYHLGDFAVGKPDHARRMRERIACRTIHLIWGNHDDRNVAPLFTSVNEMLELSFEGRRIVLCHYAMAVWNKSHHGSWHLYGHSHGSAEASLHTLLPGRRSLDVGVDHAFQLTGQYRPFSIAEIQKILESRPGHVIDHHGER